MNTNYEMAEVNVEKLKSMFMYCHRMQDKIITQRQLINF